MTSKSNIIQLFKRCLDILRDSEYLVGTNALRNLSHLLILRLIEPYIGVEIQFESYPYDFTDIHEECVEKLKTKLFSLVYFKNLLQSREDNLVELIRLLWEKILSVHPSTKNIFRKDAMFDIQHKSTFEYLMNELNKIDLLNTEYDVLGDAYEEVIQNVMTGKVYGQFFTPPCVKKLMVELIEPVVYENGSIDTCCDPTMGTAGFLTSYIKQILYQAKKKNISLDWSFIKQSGIYGKEIEYSTYDLAVSNMLISTGHMFNHLDRGDSIRFPIQRKFDIVLANPPFGIKGLKYNDFIHPYKETYLPISSDNAVSLFIQVIISILKINGRCAVVLPMGQELMSKSNKTMIAIRKLLLKTCELKECIHLPRGIFTYTSIQTCILYFIKKRNSEDVFESRNQKNKYYKFKNGWETNQIKFYQVDFESNTKSLLDTISIEEIEQKKYSLNHLDYATNHRIRDTSKHDFKMIHELFTFLPKSKRAASYGKVKGNYPFFKSSLKVESFVDEPDYQEECLIIGDGGEPSIHYSTQFSCTNHCYVLKRKQEAEVFVKYVYYYLLYNLEMMKSLFHGVGIKNLSKTNLKSIPIPILSKEKQKEIITYCDNKISIIKKLQKSIHDTNKEIESYISSLHEDAF